MTKNDEDNLMRSWRVFTPILLMVLSGILAWSGFAMQSYLGQIVNTVNEVRQDLKNFMKESTTNINNIDKRVTVLESKAGIIKERVQVTDNILY